MPLQQAGDMHGALFLPWTLSLFPMRATPNVATKHLVCTAPNFNLHWLLGESSPNQENKAFYLVSLPLFSPVPRMSP